jgi:hypothetical protein
MFSFSVSFSGPWSRTIEVFGHLLWTLAELILHIFLQDQCVEKNQHYAVCNELVTKTNGERTCKFDGGGNWERDCKQWTGDVFGAHSVDEHSRTAIIAIQS